MRVLASTMVILMLATAHATPPSQSPVASAPASASASCGGAGYAHVRTTLYFGLTRPTGMVNEAEWQTFLRTQVTPRFPDGLTVWEAKGQWRRPDGRIERERSKVLLLIHDDSAEAREMLGALVTDYKKTFEQESVLWERSPVCATF